MNRIVNKDTVGKLCEGDHRAFETVFLAYFNRVKYFITGLIKSEEDAEELSQELFVKIWDRRGSIDRERNFNAYIYMMARNAALNFIKHNQVKESYRREAVFQTAESDTSEEILISREMKLLEELVVESMPEQRRRIYRLSREEGLRNDEIAEQLGVSKKTVENQLSLALKQLRTVLRLLPLFFFFEQM